MKKYMVERYLPGVTVDALEAANARLARAAEEFGSHGVALRYLGMTFIPEEESCFCRFESDDADDVRRACEQAAVPFARIVEVHDL